MSQLQLFDFTSKIVEKQGRVEKKGWEAEGKKGEIYKQRNKMPESHKVSSSGTWDNHLR